MSETDAAEAPKATRHRSPNHPSLSLSDAVQRTKMLFDAYGKREVAVATALEKIGYSNARSSAAGGAAAALIAYGLVDATGRGKARKLAVTELGERIVRNAPNRNALVKEAALKPSIHKEMFDEFVEDGGLAHNDVLLQYVKWDREDGTFNEDSAQPFINRFRDTISFAQLTKSDGSGDDSQDLGGDNGQTDHKPGSGLQVGSVVQWTSQGQWQFSTPLPIARIEEQDGKQFAYFEEKKGWAPMSELTLATDDAEAQPAQPSITLLTPTVDKVAPPPSVGPFIRFPLSGGNTFELRLGAPVTKKDFARLQQLIELSEDSLVEDSIDE